METIETYQDGILVQTKEIEQPLPSNFSGFNTQMLFANSYTHLLANTTDKIAQSRLELAAVRLELKSDNITNQDLEIFKLIWNSLVDAVPEGLLDDSAFVEWNQIAAVNHVPFTFGSDLKLELTAIYL